MKPGFEDVLQTFQFVLFELEHDKNLQKMTLAPNKDPDQPEHLPSLISLSVCLKKVWVLSWVIKANCKDSD